MKKLEEMDVNFRVQTNLDRNDLQFYDALQLPFRCYGLLYENGMYRRMPEAVARRISDGVYGMHGNTAGGRLCFQTDSPVIAVWAKRGDVYRADHFPITGSASFDLYVRAGGRQKFVTTLCSALPIEEDYQASYDFGHREMRQITLNFPTYCDVIYISIGLHKDAVVEEFHPYKNPRPWVFYGSSITQGGCASHPGNAYPSILSRNYAVDIVNLGFSGNAKGEQAMADYIAGLDMDLFFFDYDYNAPDVEHLKNTHEKMFRTIRQAQPNLPIILMTAITKTEEQMQKERADVIYRTYTNAISDGDLNVYFWNGKTGFAPYEEYGTVEGIHPNDHGFWGMAQSLQMLINDLDLFHECSIS